MSAKKIHTGYLPRALQEELHLHLKRFNVLVCHRRFGKTVFAINEMVDQGLRQKKRNPRYAYIAPTYGQAKRVAWDILKDATRQIPGSKINEAELRVDIERSDNDRIRYTLLGAENPGSVRGIYLDGCILDEYAEMDTTMWSQVIRPALSDRRGWAIFIGTPKGSNHFHKIYRAAKQMAEEGKDWFTAMYKASETGVVALSELEAARATMSPEEYDQEFECSFSAGLTGAYYAPQFKFLKAEGRITKVPWEPAVPVMTGWDLGIDDSTAIWFLQQVGKELRVIDYMEVNNKDLPWIAKELQAKPYMYNWHYLPHDGKVRELQTGKTRIEQLQKLGLKGQIEAVKKLPPEDGISATRILLPKMWFDEMKTDYGRECLESYERVFDHKEGVFKSRPRHNWASHGADAMRTFAVGYTGDEEERRDRRLPDQQDTDYDPFEV